MKRLLCVLLSAFLLFAALPASAAQGERSVRILFTHDIHSHFLGAESLVDGQVREEGGAARLKALIDRNRTSATAYLDAGDFSMGTLLQAGYSSDAYELRLLGEAGCDVTTFGNHEFDYGDEGVAKMLAAAKASGDPLPRLVQSNMVTSGDLTADQRVLAEAMADYGAEEYTVLDVNGVKMAVFGLFGLDCLSCAPTTNMTFTNYIEAAKATVGRIKEREDADLIVCLSHSGTAGDGLTGEDIDLAREVPDIDVIISGHTHTKYERPVTVGHTVLVSCGEYLTNLGLLDLTLGEDGPRVAYYRLIPLDEAVAEEAGVPPLVSGIKEEITEGYLAGENVGFDEVICRSEFDFMPLSEMEATHQEYPFGNLIADSYMYEARRNGITDIDVALVGLGTIRGSFTAGDITTEDAFEICSLGVGADGSAGHPLVSAYITGKELKMLVELDASLGPMVSYIKMSYSGLRYTFNEKRMLLDRVTDICLVRPDGTEEEIEDKKLYRVACNMYAANMLGMLNGLTYGILKITPKFADGTPVEDLYDCSLKDTEDREIKEWAAFKNYLISLPKKDGVPTIPASYAAPEGRKTKVAEGGLAVLAHPGATTVAVIALPVVLLAVIVLLIATRKRRKARRALRKARRAEKRRAKRAETDQK